MKKIGVIVGSLRKESFSKKLALNVMELFSDNFKTDLIEIGHLPFYNQDLDVEGNVDKAYTAFREQVKQYDGFLFVTPEYNRSLPAVLKNALDIGSRPKVDNVWDNKPAAIISQSPGGLAGFGANHHLRQTLTAINMPVVQHPEAYIGNVASLLDQAGKLSNDDSRAFLQTFVDAFEVLIKQVKTGQ